MELETTKKVAPIWQPHENFLKFYFRVVDERLRKTLQEFAPQIDADLILGLHERLAEPWPAWVLHIAAKLIHLHAPTIKLADIESGIAWLHWIALEMTPDRKGKPPPPEFPGGRKEVMEICGRAIGHVEATESALTRLLEAFPDLLLSYREGAKKDLNPMMEFTKAQLAEANLEEVAIFGTALADARSKTVDKNGEIRGTSASEAYRQMLWNWPEIEQMSGPSELCAFLRPHLGSGSEEHHLDRVKKMCRRLGIKFLPRKGTRARQLPSPSQ
jgi:hypothetical protein